MFISRISENFNRFAPRDHTLKASTDRCLEKQCPSKRGLHWRQFTAQSRKRKASNEEVRQTQQPKRQNLQQKTSVVGTAPKPALCIFNPKSQLVSDSTEFLYRQRPSPCSHSLRILFSDQCCLLSGFKKKDQSCKSVLLISISTILLYKISYSSTLILSVLLLFTYLITHETWDFLMILFQWKYVNWITVLFLKFILPWWLPLSQFKWLSIC